jgi:hypothetical protein
MVCTIVEWVFQVRTLGYYLSTTVQWPGRSETALPPPRNNNAVQRMSFGHAPLFPLSFAWTPQLPQLSQYRRHAGIQVSIFSR